MIPNPYKDARGYYFSVGQKVARAVAVGRWTAELVIEEVTKVLDDGRVCLNGRAQPITRTDRLMIIEH